MDARRFAAKANSVVREASRTLKNETVRKAWIDSIVLGRIVRRTDILANYVAPRADAS